MTDDLKEVMQFMQKMYADLKNDINSLKSDSKETKERLINVETHIENVTDKNIQLLAEGFSPIPERLNKLDTVYEDMQDLKSDVDIIKKAVRANFEEHTTFAKAK